MRSRLDQTSMHKSTATNPRSGQARYVAAIDLGASNGRIILGCFQNGRLESNVVLRFDHQARSCGGYLRWDWNGIRSFVHKGLLRAAQTVAPAPLEAVSCCAWAQDFGLLDVKGNQIFEPVSYRDPRTLSVFKHVRANIKPEALVKRVGSVAHNLTTLVQLRAMVEQEPDILIRARHLLFIADLVHYDLCGAYATDMTLATASQLANLKTGRWDRALLKILGIPSRFLPNISASPCRLGRITVPDLLPAMERTAVLSTAGHDTAAALAATPADRDTLLLSSGTWSMIGCRQSQARTPQELIAKQWALLGLSDGQWGLVKGISGLWLIQECRRAWMEQGQPLSFEQIMLAAQAYAPAAVLIDPESPLFQSPADMPTAIGEACRQAGQPAPTTVGEIAAAVFTSLALNYRRALDTLTHAIGHSFKRVLIIGGGNRNTLLNQLAADALKLPVLTGPSEAAALGNLLIQAQWLGIIRSDEQRADIVAAHCPPRQYTPQGNWAEESYARFLKLKHDTVIHRRAG